MKDELAQRVQTALDEGAGLAGDAELGAALEAAGEAARQEAEALERLDGALRALPEADFSDEVAEALATRIEQRLEEDLARMPDPTAPPIFTDADAEPPSADAPADATPATVAADAGRTSGEYSLANLTSLSVQDAPAVDPSAPLSRPRKERGDQTLELDLGDVKSEPPMPLSAARPAPPPVPPKLTKLSDERASIPSVAPLERDLADGVQSFSQLPAPPTDLAERRRKRRTLFYVGSGLAAAAVALLAVVTGLGTLQDAEPAAVASTEAAPLAGPGHEAASADYAESEASEEAAPAAQGRRTGGAPLGEPVDIGSGNRGASTGTVMPAEATVAAAEPEAMLDSEAESLAASRTAAPPAPTTMASPAPDEGATPRPQMRARRASTATTRPTAMAAAGGSGGVPTRADVTRALQAVQPAVSQCARGRTGVVTVNITVGSSGRVRNAVVQGEFAGTQQGSCVARAVRRARFPEFRRDSFNVRYPFRL